MYQDIYPTEQECEDEDIKMGYRSYADGRTMKAIIKNTQESGGPRTYLLGLGRDEHEARMSAFEHVNGGNDFDEEYADGILVDADPEIDAIYSAGYPLGVTLSGDTLVIDWEAYRASKEYDENQLQAAKAIMLEQTDDA